MPKFPAHPLADAFPLMVGAELKQLAESIKKHGLKEPIIKLCDVILDGRNRQIACEMAGVTPEYFQYDGATDTESLVAFIQAANLHRRHMDEKARTTAATRLLRESQKGPVGPFQKPPTAKEVSASTGTSVRNVKRIKRVLKDGPPDVKAALEKGELSAAGAEAKTVAAKAKISGGDTFNTTEIDSAPSRPEQKVRNGKPSVTAKQRKDCNDQIDKLIRMLDKLDIYSEFVVPLSQIKERVKGL